MKKTATLIATALVLVATSAMAAKMPKNICLDLDTLTQDYHNLVFKTAGKMTVLGAKYKTYTITGIVFNASGIGPISGSAYANSDGTLIHATYTTDIDKVFASYVVPYNPQTGEGFVKYRFEDNDGTTIETGIDTFTVMDCDSFGQ
jgi:hypothetical protein